MSESTHGSLVARVERLERENRRLKRVALSAAVLAVAGLLLAPSAPKKEAVKVLKAREIQVVDDVGATRITMKVEANGDPALSIKGPTDGAIQLALVQGRPVLSLSDESRVRANLEIGKDGTILDLGDAEGRRVARLVAGGAAGLVVDDSKSAGTEASLLLSDKGPALSLSSPGDRGDASVTLLASPDSGPLVAASKGLAAARLDVSRGGDPSMTISDAEGRDRAVLGVTKLEVETKRKGKAVEKQRTDPASLVLFDARETVVWKAP
ncbi:MAG: hypothetical protein LAO51_16400 [Acidobacteriia bacterium]|nr:hypothetical protein [Terriglobia bacterium]